MQLFSILGYAIERSETLLIPAILGEQPELELSQFSGKAAVIQLANKEPKTAEEMLETLKKEIEKKENVRIIFADIIEATNPDNNIIFFDNTFKNLKIKEGDKSENFVKGTLGDIIRDLTSSSGVDPYYIAEEEDGTILSITRKT